MPLGETLAVLATLANAYQAFRISRNPSEPKSTEVLMPDPLDVIKLDAVLRLLSRQEEAYLASVRRIDVLALCSGIVLIVAAVIKIEAARSAELLVVSIALFLFLLASSLIAKYLVTLSPFKPAVFQGEPVESAIQGAERVETLNERRLKTLEILGDLLKVLVAVQVLLLAALAMT